MGKLQFFFWPVVKELVLEYCILKDMYGVGLLSRKPLYQLQAERILRLEILAQAAMALVGKHTKEPTLEFFQKFDYFGMKKDNLVVFEQGMLPTFTNDGRIILERKGTRW
jgi:UDP-N-acetylglucosamine/UDP-N-acetylgalactosamine diphosphorylase